MNSTILKSLLLTFVIFESGFAFYKHIPTEQFLRMQFAMGIAIVLLFFILKNDMLKLLLLWFIVALFKGATGGAKLTYLPDIFADRMILVLIAVIFTVEMLMKKIRVLSFSAAEVAMIGFSIYVIFSMIISGTISEQGQGVSPGKFLTAYGFPFAIFFISKNIANDENKIKKIFFLFVFIGLYLGITAIIEYFQWRQLLFPRYLWRARPGRAGGPFLHPAVNGIVMGMLLLVPIFLFLHENKRWKKYLYVITAICLLAGILFTFTRSAWVSSLTAIFTVPIFMPRVRKLLFVSFLMIGILSLSFSYFYDIKIRQLKEKEFITKNATLIERIVNRFTAEETIEGREDLYKFAFKMFLNKPFLGHGYGGFQQAKKGYGATMLISNQFAATRAGIHNTLLSLLVDLGLIGLSFYLFIVIYIVNICRKLYIKLPRETFLGKDLIVACIGIFIVYLISIQFFDVRFVLFPNALFFCIAGITVGLNQRILQNEINLSMGNTT